MIEIIYLFIANGTEEVEAIAPADILRRAGCDVRIVGVGGKKVTCAHQTVIDADITVEEAGYTGLEMIILPGGGRGTQNLEKDKKVQEFIDYAFKNDLWIGAICAAPSILGHRGLLKGKRVICFPGFEKELDGAVITDDSVVIDGKIITAAGMGVAVDFGLALAACIVGRDKSEQIRKAIQCRE